MMHILIKYKTNLEFPETTYHLYVKGITARIITLGLSVERLNLELMRLFLSLGANVETLIAEGLSAPELAVLNIVGCIPSRKT